MACLYESAYDPAYTYIAQDGESDIAFLSKLCHDACISLKATNNILVLFDQAAKGAISPVLEIIRGDLTYTNWRLMSGEAGTNYTSCRVSYIDPEKGNIEGLAFAEGFKDGRKGDRRLEISAKIYSKKEAEELAKMKLYSANKHGLSAQFSFPGDPALVAGTKVFLSGWGIWDGENIIKRAEHSIGSQGYITRIDLRRTG
jgi:phage protein D